MAKKADPPQPSVSLSVAEDGLVVEARRLHLEAIKCAAELLARGSNLEKISVIRVLVPPLLRFARSSPSGDSEQEREMIRALLAEVRAAKTIGNGNGDTHVGAGAPVDDPHQAGPRQA